MSELPLFPLKTVLFPGGPLPLRIFEPRYLDMLSHCMRTDTGFGVVLIEDGDEAGAASRVSPVGTTARIADWYQGQDGLLGILAVGEKRFQLNSVTTRSDGLQVGDVTEFEQEPLVSLPERFHVLAQILEGVMEDLGEQYQILDKDYSDATWVGFRLAEVLPVGNEQKQAFLEMTDALARLELLHPVLEQMGHDT